MRLGKALLTVAGASILLAALVGVASAGKLSTSSQTLRATFREVRFSGGFGSTTCPVTVEGSFHERTISKNSGALTGYITRAIIGTCATGTATILAETLPWHVRYNSFTGTLPNITSVVANIVGTAFQIHEPVFGITCLARATEGEPARITFNREAGGVLTTAVLSGSVGTNCGASGTFTGTSTSFTVLNSATRITVTLI
jgi:hypothetical protein